MAQKRLYCSEYHDHSVELSMNKRWWTKDTTLSTTTSSKPGWQSQALKIPECGVGDETTTYLIVSQYRMRNLTYFAADPVDGCDWMGCLSSWFEWISIYLFLFELGRMKCNTSEVDAKSAAVKQEKNERCDSGCRWSRRCYQKTDGIGLSCVFDRLRTNPRSRAVLRVVRRLLVAVLKVSWGKGKVKISKINLEGNLLGHRTGLVTERRGLH